MEIDQIQTQWLYGGVRAVILEQQRHRAPAKVSRSNRATVTLKNKKVKRAVELFRNALRFRRRLDLNAADFDALTVGKDRAPKSGLDPPVRSAGRDAA